jgi:adenylate kinase
MVKRLSGRGRSDDNEETIKKRLQVNKRDAEPVVAYFDKAKKLVRVNCNDTPDGTLFSRVILRVGVYTQILVQIQAIIEGWER